MISLRKIIISGIMCLCLPAIGQEKAFQFTEKSTLVSGKSALSSKEAAPEFTSSPSFIKPDNKLKQRLPPSEPKPVFSAEPAHIKPKE